MMMMSRSRVVIDLCDTLAQVTESIEGIYGPMPDPLSRFHPAVYSKDFWADPDNRVAREILKDSNPFPGAVGTVNRISRKHEIVYLTARPEWSKNVSERWLRQNGFPQAPVICTPDKYSWVLKHGAAGALEDFPEHIIKLQRLVPVFVPSQPWNKNLGVQFNWKEENNEVNLHVLERLQGHK